MLGEDISDALTVHKYLKVKFLAENSDYKFSLYEEMFILRSPTGKPIISSTVIDDVLEIVLEQCEDVGFYTS